MYCEGVDTYDQIVQNWPQPDAVDNFLYVPQQIQISYWFSCVFDRVSTHFTRPASPVDNLQRVT